MKPKSTQRILNNRPIVDSKRRNAPQDNVNSYSNASKTNRNVQTSIKQTNKFRNKKMALTQDSSDDYLQSN